MELLVQRFGRRKGAVRVVPLQVGKGTALESLESRQYRSEALEVLGESQLLTSLYLKFDVSNISMNLVV